MATQGKRASTPRKTGLPTSDYPIPPIYVVNPRPVEQDWESVMGWVAACVLVGMLLPILGMLYLDVLQMKQEAKQQIEQVEKLRRKIERKERDKEPSTISDNPVFDRVRRPLSLSLPRPKELE